MGASDKSDRATAAEPVVSALRDGIPSASDYANAERANAIWGSAINGPHVAVLSAMLAREKAQASSYAKAMRDASRLTAEMCNVIGAMEGSLIYAALAGCSEKMDEIAQGMEARSDETRSGSAVGDSPVPQGSAPTPSATQVQP